MTLRFALLALPLALAGCDSQAMQTMQNLRMPWDKTEPVAAAPAAPAVPTIPEPTGASPTVQPLEIEGRTAKVATADAETLAVTDLTAAGEGWAASVKGTTARFEPAGGKAANITVRRIPYSGGVEYIGVLGGQPFVLRVNAQDCGGQPLTATVRASGRTLPGCAAPAAAAAAATPAAPTSARPPRA